MWKVLNLLKKYVHSDQIWKVIVALTVQNSTQNTMQLSARPQIRKIDSIGKLNQ